MTAPRLDPRLDRVVETDSRSDLFPVRALAAMEKPPRSYTWGCDAWLDQGREGQCVGYAFAHELAAKPKPVPQAPADATRWYKRAQDLDQWPGSDYDGTSVLAGAKAVRESGLIAEYRWARGLADLITAVGRVGPAVLGLEWRTSMFHVGADGFIRATGDVAGGHAILCRGVNVKGRYFTLRNSWGKDWGVNGDCRISWDDMESLLHADGEACVPLTRTLTRTA